MEEIFNGCFFQGVRSTLTELALLVRVQRSLFHAWFDLSTILWRDRFHLSMLFCLWNDLIRSSFYVCACVCQGYFKQFAIISIASSPVTITNKVTASCHVHDCFGLSSTERRAALITFCWFNRCCDFRAGLLKRTPHSWLSYLTNKTNPRWVTVTASEK